MNELVKKYMQQYELTEEEALELIKEDEEVDKMTVGEINKSYSKEEREAIKSVTRVDTYQKKADRKPREVKINPTKIEIIKAIADELVEMGFEKVEVTNAQKYITFSKGSDNYELNLVQKRPPKK